MPVLYLSQGQGPLISKDLLDTIIVSDVRSFSQDPRFCLSVMAEIACRALSPAVNDPAPQLMSLAEVYEYYPLMRRINLMKLK